VPSFQTASEFPLVPAAPPLSAGQYAISSCELWQVGSLLLTIGAVGDGVGAVVGAALGDAVGSGEGGAGDGDGVPLGALDGDRTTGLAVHDASSAISPVDRTTHIYGARRAFASARRLGCPDIVDVVTPRKVTAFRVGAPLRP
jgi:hypothetical protein